MSKLLNLRDNDQVLIKEVPNGSLQDNTFEIVSRKISAEDVNHGFVLIQVDYVSVDPTMKIWLDPKKTYLAPLQPGDIMRAVGIGCVIFSRSSKFTVGDHVLGFELGWQKLAIADEKALQKIRPLPGNLPMTAYLGVLGHTGLAAYFGMTDIGDPKPGETVVVSGAAGATGSVAGQIAKIKGCTVVGIAGSEEKCAWLKDELGFDHAINYRKPNFEKSLKQSCPDGIDVYFDNVGGTILDSVLKRINKHARIIICGAISQYNAPVDGQEQPGPQNYLALVNKSAKMQGFLVFDYVKRYSEAIQSLAVWVAKGKLKSKEHIITGLENAPKALNMLFESKNFGKLIVKVSGDSLMRSKL